MSLSRMVGKVKLTMIKNAPELWLAGGLVLGGVSIFLASKETLKVESIVEEHKEDMAKIHEAKESLENGETINTEDGGTYELEDVKKDTTIVYVRTGLKVAKNYAPAVVAAGLSVVAILTSHGIMKKRYVALGAAYTALDRTFKTYRERVRTEAGEATDKHYMYGTKTEEVIEFYEDEKGRQKQKITQVETIDDKLYSPFAKRFNKNNPNWEKNNELNRFFLAQVQAACQQKLRRDGYLWLNEVYRRLGMEPTVAGQQFGWVFDDISGNSPSFIDFGIFEVNMRDNGKDYDEVDMDSPKVGAYEDEIILDFNCVNIVNLVPLETV